MPAATMTAFVNKSRSQRLPMTATACLNTDAALAHQQHMAAAMEAAAADRANVISWSANRRHGLLG